MIFSVISLFVIFQCQYLVSTNHVMEWSPTGHGYQTTFPWLKKAQLIKQFSLTLESPNGYKYNIDCKVYKSADPKADIYTKEGVLLDSIFLEHIGQTTCNEENLRNYISPQNPYNGVVKIIYLWAGRKGTCVERDYKPTELPFMATVERFSYPDTDCPDHVKQFLEGFNLEEENVEGKRKPGGIVALAFVGVADLMDYTDHFLEAGRPQKLIFEGRQGISFKFICREDKTTRSASILMGSIVHEDDRGEDIVLEKFTLKSCSIDYINVNRQILYLKTRFKSVFKTDKGICYEREYTKMNVNLLDNYDQTTLVRMEPKEVKCPIKFEGDINFLRHRSWYKFLSKRKPFSRDLRTPAEIELSNKAKL